VTQKNPDFRKPLMQTLSSFGRANRRLKNRQWRSSVEDEAYVAMMALADGRLTKLQLAGWLKEKSKPINRKAGVSK
jgi:hypothetical protein